MSYWLWKGAEVRGECYWKLGKWRSTLCNGGTFGKPSFTIIWKAAHIFNELVDEDEESRNFFKGNN